MSRRRKKSSQPDLPFLDLPLQEGEEVAIAETKIDPGAVDEPAEREQLQFSDDDLEPVVAETASVHAIDGELEAPRSEVSVLDRLLAGLADLGLNSVAIGATAVSVRALGVEVGTEAWPAFAGLAAVFSFLYCVVPLAFWGQTPGMAWVGLVTRSSADEPLTFGQGVLRWCGALITLGLLGLPLLMALGGRSLSDRLSDSTTWPVTTQPVTP